MTRREFLNNLYRRLGNLSREQAEQYLTYYAEMLADRMEEGMSEEEAVASMEDVETIAQRILQDEGVAPTYPDMFPTGGGAEEETPPPPRWRSWNRLPQSVWIALAAVAVLFGLGKQMIFSGGASTSGWAAADSAVREAGAVDEASSYAPLADAVTQWDNKTLDFGEREINIEGFHVGSDGIWYSEDDESLYIGPDGIRYNGEDGAFYIGPDGVRVSEPVEENGYGYSGPLCEVNGSFDVASINVTWDSGMVEVQSWHGDTVQFQEDGAETLQYECYDGYLGITGGCSDSRLKLLIPYGLGVYLNISGNAGVWITELTVDSLDIYSSSGNVSCADLYTDWLNVQTTSGDVLLSEVEAPGSFSVGTSSGDVVLSDITGEVVDIDTTSGDVTGTGTAELWNVDTSSGDIDLYPHISNELYLDTTSGDIHLAPDGQVNNITVSASSGNAELLLPNRTFAIVFSSSSGKLRSDLPLTPRDGAYWYNADAGDYCSVYVDTTSGNLTLKEA